MCFKYKWITTCHIDQTEFYYENRFDMWDINYDTMKWLDPAGKTLRIVEICKFFKIKAAVYWFYKNKLRK